MHRFRLTIATLLTLTLLLLTGCGWLPFHRHPTQPTLKTAPVVRGQAYKSAIILTQVPATPFGRRLGERYLEILGHTIGKESSRISLLTPGEPDFPQFMNTLAQAGRAGDIYTSMAPGRQQGFQGVILAAVTNLRANTHNWGFLWFSRTIYTLSFSLTIDLYDPFTGSKIVSRIQETTLKIDSDEYESFQDGSADYLEELDEEVADTAEDFGELVAEHLLEQPWKASVIGFEDGLIRLAVDSGAFIEPDQKLAVYEARRVIQNRHGQQFIIPGIKITEARVTRIGNGMIEAAPESTADIQPGDLAVVVP